MSEQAATRRPDVGGQAVIEGVMMRSPSSFTVVCRRPDGAIVIKEEAWRPVWGGLRLLRWPLLRGAVVLLESLVNGVSALTFSANQQVVAETEEDAAAGTGKRTATTTPPLRSLGARAADQPSEASSLATWGMVAISLAFGLALFVGAPHLAAWGLGEVLGFDSASFTFHAVDGAIKLALLIGYMAAISLLPDVRRVFQYHGAEHKAIFTYERGLPLTVENARAQSRFHPRCGTSFLLIVIGVSVVLFSAALTYRISDTVLVDHLLKIAIKIPLMFPVAGLAYELIKLAGKKCDTSLVARALSAPGMWLQKITTREPDDQQLEIALVSIRKTLWREGLGAGAPPIAARGVEVYASGDEIDLPLVAA
ncbi:MAG TPA: DUF1385 domain-containing protein [Kofleriaceae bacterium]|nr:DUF1385 domain-containing protein [Kofleriaceae bacterium]